MSCGDLAPDSIVCHNAKIALGTIVREPQPASLVMFEFCRASYYEDIAHRQFVARHLRGNHKRRQFLPNLIKMLAQMFAPTLNLGARTGKIHGKGVVIARVLEKA